MDLSQFLHVFFIENRVKASWPQCQAATQVPGRRHTQRQGLHGAGSDWSSHLQGFRTPSQPGMPWSLETKPGTDGRGKLLKLKTQPEVLKPQLQERISRLLYFPTKSSRQFSQ